MKKLKKQHHIMTKDKLTMMLRQSLGKNVFDHFSLQLSPYAFPFNPFDTRKFHYKEVFKDNYSRQLHSKGRKLRVNISSQKSNRNSLVNRFNTTFHKQSNHFQVQYRPHSDLVNYSLLAPHQVNVLDKGKLNSKKAQGSIKSESKVKHNNYTTPKDASLPSLPKGQQENKSFIKKDGLISFSGSKVHLATTYEKIEELANIERLRPYTLITNDLKPMFFFNVKGKTENSMNTPSFIRSFRDSSIQEEVKEGFSPKPKDCIKIHNKAKGNIFISKTTIINNITNPRKTTPKKTNKLKVAKLSHQTKNNTKPYNKITS